MMVLRRAARALLASAFIVDGINTLRSPKRLSDQAALAVGKLHELTGLPNDPDLFVRINGAIMATAGTALALGKAPRAAALTLAAIMIPTTYATSSFWEENDPPTRAELKKRFTINLSLVGGLLVTGVDTEGKPGITWRIQNAREHKENLAELKRELTKKTEDV